MRKMKKVLALSLAAVMTAGLLSACGNSGNQETTASGGETTTVSEGGDETTAPEGESTGAFNLAVCLASNPQTIDPALNSSTDGAMMIQHMFEGLLKWADSGDGNAKLVNGQAADYTVSDDGLVYTFTLRDDIKWSDGQDVTAEDFVYAWQRVVDPKTAADYNYMIDMVVNANEIMKSEKDKSELGVKAIDDKTFEVTLTYDCPYFLEVCAFPVTLPIRQDIIEANGDQWTFDPATYIGNGAYKMTEWVQNSYIAVAQNEHYYDIESIGPDTIRFALMDDDNAILASFKSGDLQFIRNMPVDEIPALKESGELVVVDYIGTYYACFNNSVEPFDDPLVREAFSLVIDRNYIVEQVTRTGEVPATGYVPAGIYDAEGPDGDDFRTNGGEYYSVAAEDYEANCERARELLAEAGYPNGEGFPTVEYLYNTDDRHKVIGEALQNMWATELGVTVTLNNQDWGVFLETRKDGNFQISRNGWIADYNDPVSFLDMWLTGGGNNDAQYSNAAYDELIQQAKSTSDPQERMDFMHQAEDILMKDDHFSAPIYFYTEKYMLSDDVEGLFYTPLGYFFFWNVTQK